MECFWFLRIKIIIILLNHLIPSSIACTILVIVLSECPNLVIQIKDRIKSHFSICIFLHHNLIVKIMCNSGINDSSKYSRFSVSFRFTSDNLGATLSCQTDPSMSAQILSLAHVG